MCTQVERMAEVYLSKGWSLLPVARESKRPLLEWKRFTQTRPTIEEVRSWYSQWPTANIGIITGPISNLVVIDLDGSEGIAEAAHLKLSSPTSVLTGKGKHLYYQCPTNELKNSVRLFPGIDIRAENGFVLAPPSIHANGRRYRFLGPVPVAGKLPPFPAHIFAFAVSATNSTTDSRNEPDWIVKALEEMTDGNIDITLFRICSWFRNAGASEATCAAFVRPYADRCGASVGHLEEKIRNVWSRYAPNIQRQNGHSMEPSVSGLVLRSPTDAESILEYDKWKQSTECQLVIGTNTGYAKLDTMLHGGLNSTRLFTLAARTGTGKTNWLIGVSRTFCEAGKKVLFFSTETQYQELWDRYIATLQQSGKFKEHGFFVCDSFTPKIEDVEEAIKKIMPDLFIFDHINHVSEEQHELGAFMQGLNWLKRKYNCCGIVSAQLNRSADWVDLKTGEKVTPRMSMIKGSGTIEQASSRVLLLAEQRVTNECTEIVGNLDKNDRGPKGLIHFGLMSNPYRMVELP